MGSDNLQEENNTCILVLREVSMMTLVLPVVYHFEALDEWGGCFLTLQTAEDSERGGAGVGLPPGP